MYSIAPVVEKEFVIGVGILQHFIWIIQEGHCPPLVASVAVSWFVCRQEFMVAPFEKMRELDEQFLYLCLNPIPVKGGKAGMTSPAYSNIEQVIRCLRNLICTEVAHPEGMTAYLSYTEAVGIRYRGIHVALDTFIGCPMGIIASCVD